MGRLEIVTNFLVAVSVSFEYAAFCCGIDFCEAHHVVKNVAPDADIEGYC